MADEIEQLRQTKAQVELEVAELRMGSDRLMEDPVKADDGIFWLSKEELKDISEGVISEIQPSG